MKRLHLLKSMLLLFALIVGSGYAWATDPSVTFTFNSTAGLSALGIDAPSTGSGTNLGNSEYTLTPITMTATDGGTATRVWNSSGTYSLRVYKGTPNNGTLTFSTTSSYNIKSVAFGVGSSWSASTGTMSGSTWSGSAQSVTFTTTANVTISTITVTYTTAGGSDPSISVTPTSLSTFTYVQGNGPSTTKTVSVSGSNLTANISLSLGESSNYEMCLTSDGSYTNSLSLSPSNGTVSATNVYVRLKSGLTAGDKNGSITLTSTGATNATVNLTGSVTTLGVTYNDNGAGSGTAPTDATAYAYNAEVTVIGNTGSLAKTGHSFGGWNTKNDGEGTNYAAGDKFNITANTTLYAKWVINTNSVTLPDNDEYGEYSMNKSNPVAYGTEVTLTYTPAEGHENYVATWSVNGTPISGNKFTMPDAAVTVTVSLNEVLDMTLANSYIVSAGAAANGYAAKTITDSKNKTWNAYAIKNQHSKATSSYHFLQIRAYDSSNSTAYYIQVPEYGRKITKLEMTVSGANTPMTDGGNSATLFFSASNSTSATGTGVASGSGGSKVTIDCSSLNLNTGYITAGGAVRIWDIKVTYDPIRLNGSGYATYAGLTPIDYSDDSKFSAWAIASITGNAITFSKITSKVPAGTGVLLMGTAGQAVEPVVAASGTAPAANLLTGITTATAVTADQYYGLSGKKFVKVNAGTVPAGRALLPVSAISTARELNFVFDDETTGISAIENMEPTTENAAIYNLNGQRVTNPSRGLYIVNGKKVIFK